MQRPETLEFIGERRPDGEPVAHLAGYGIAARDLDAARTARLTDEQVKLALDSGLYRAGKTAKTETAKTAKPE